MSHDHDPGQPVADFNISLPPSVDVCSLHVRISAGNSAGMSAPSEAVEVGMASARLDSQKLSIACYHLPVKFPVML